MQFRAQSVASILRNTSERRHSKNIRALTAKAPLCNARLLAKAHLLAVDVCELFSWSFLHVDFLASCHVQVDRGEGHRNVKPSACHDCRFASYRDAEENSTRRCIPQNAAVQGLVTSCTCIHTRSQATREEEHTLVGRWDEAWRRREYRGILP